VELDIKLTNNTGKQYDIHGTKSIVIDDNLDLLMENVS
jgi:hypothetical protein